jgi:bacteriocin biosynthesis cyclodehydratase domain-containing protein
VTADDARDRGAARSGFVGLEGGLAPGCRLHPSVEVFEAADGDVYLLRAGGAPAAVVRRPQPADRLLLRRLAAGPVTALPESEEAGRLAPLRAAGLVVEVREVAPLDAAAAERFSRQLPYFAESGDPAGVQRRLRAAAVTVIGCGGLGTWTLAALAGLGVGRFTLVDDDRVEPSNLNRQVIYAAADIGARKVDAEVEVRTVSSRVASVDDAAAVTTGADAVVLAADWPPYELARWVNSACVAAGVPFLTAGLQPPLLKVGPMYTPHRGPCFACHERRLAAEFPFYRELADYRRAHPAPATTLAPAAGAVGTLVALEVMHLLIGDEPVATEGRAFLLDMRTLEQRWEAIERDPDCPVCAQC